MLAPRLLAAGALLAALLGPSGATAQSPDPSPIAKDPPPIAGWPQFLHDAAHTGTTDAETAITPKNVKRLALAWWAPSGFNGSPSVADGVVYIGAGDGTLNAYPVDCGVAGAECAPQWHGDAGSIIDWSSPAIADGLVTIGAGGDLTAWDVGCATDGGACTPRWTGTSGDIGYSSPAMADGLVAIGGNDGRLAVYDQACATDGGSCTPLWTAAIGDEVHTSPAIADGIVYIGGQDGRLTAYPERCREDGGVCDPLWVGQAAGAFENSSPVVVDGVVYAGAQDGYLYAWPVGCAADGATCEPLWRGKAGGPIQASVAVTDGMVYLPTFGQRLLAFETGCREDGGICAPAWRTARMGRGRGQIASSPAVANGVVFVGSQGTDQQDGRLWAYPARCRPVAGLCAPLWRSDSTGDLINASPAVADGRVYIASNDGRLLAFSLGGGDTTAPTVSAPTVRLDSPATSGDKDVIVSWSGTDAGTGIDRYRLQQQDPDGRWVRVPIGSALGTSVRVTLEPGIATRFRVRAVDGAGTWSRWATGPTVTTELVDDADARVERTADAWTETADPTAIAETLATASTTGATASLTFEGSGVAVIAPRIPDNGKADILLDGVRVRTIDLGSSPGGGTLTAPVAQQVVYAASWPATGPHTVAIVVRATPGRPTVSLDAFRILD